MTPVKKAGVWVQFCVDVAFIEVLVGSALLAVTAWGRTASTALVISCFGLALFASGAINAAPLFRKIEASRKRTDSRSYVAQIEGCNGPPRSYWGGLIRWRARDAKRSSGIRFLEKSYQARTEEAAKHLHAQRVQSAQEKARKIFGSSDSSN
ncbi:MAG: hypothetical protein H7274_00610 [Rhodoferax sp.]|nr:hypothetical protein [Rhodoferax sp.]